MSWSVITSCSLERTTGSFCTNYLLEGLTKSSSEGTLKDNDASAKFCNTQDGNGVYSKPSRDVQKSISDLKICIISINHFVL